MDPRVEIIAKSRGCDSHAVHDLCRESFAEEIAALEAEGYYVGRLEQVGIICDDGSVLPVPGEDDEQYDDDVPVFRKVESGYQDAVAESGNGDSARRTEGGKP